MRTTSNAIAVVNLKGGVAKTKTAYYLSAALHGAGQTVTLIDADPQGSALRWAEAAEAPWLTVSMPTKTIHTQVKRLSQPGQWVVIDTPPNDLAIAASAMRAANLILIPTQPTADDLAQLAETTSLAEEVQAVTDAKIAVLLTRVDRRAKAHEISRAGMESLGLHVLTAIVPQSQAMALSYGEPVADVRAYGAVADEVQGLLS